MIDYIISIPTADDVWTEEIPQPQPSVLMAEYDNGEATRAYLYSGDDPAEWGNSHTVIGSWDRATALQAGQSYDEQGNVTGTPTFSLHDDYLAHIKPMGNAEGKATDQPDTLRWQGMPEEKFIDGNSRYPADNKPFELKISRQDLTKEKLYPGWGWEVVMISEDAARDIKARAIGVYADEACTQFLYTTGAFASKDGSFRAVCPEGRRTAKPEPVYFALLEGSAKEGQFALSDSADSTKALFWKKDQGDTGESIEPWVQKHSAPYYPIGSVVTHKGSTWECTLDNTGGLGNSFEPGVWGWAQV